MGLVSTVASAIPTVSQNGAVASTNSSTGAVGKLWRAKTTVVRLSICNEPAWRPRCLPTSVKVVLLVVHSGHCVRRPNIRLRSNGEEKPYR
jgi:hypothetical protein